MIARLLSKLGNRTDSLVAKTTSDTELRTDFNFAELLVCVTDGLWE